MKFLCYMNDAKIEACVIIKSWSPLVVPDSFNPHDLVCTRNDTVVDIDARTLPLPLPVAKVDNVQYKGSSHHQVAKMLLM